MSEIETLVAAQNIAYREGHDGTAESLQLLIDALTNDLVGEVSDGR